mgnify:CR=1 FL=1|tara:strand:+ start:569 stop:835 length:267 start_codon:yes stop_codon:yes gene_type:complete
MPLINNFRSTNIWKAFVLNSLVASIVIVMGITVKSHFDTYTTDDDSKIKRSSNFTSISLTILFTFLTSFVAYTIMYFVFGFGGGMLEC